MSDRKTSNLSAIKDEGVGIRTFMRLEDFEHFLRDDKCFDYAFLKIHIHKFRVPFCLVKSNQGSTGATIDATSLLCL